MDTGATWSRAVEWSLRRSVLSCGKQCRGSDSRSRQDVGPSGLMTVCTADYMINERVTRVGAYIRGWGLVDAG